MKYVLEPILLVSGSSILLRKGELSKPSQLSLTVN